MQSARWLIGPLVAVVAGLIIAPSLAQTPPPETQRISFQIATGPVSGSYIRVGEAIARIISNPPGLARCEAAGVCGPEGLIATTRSSSGSIVNAVYVNAGRVKSAIVQADIAAAAFTGEGPFVQNGPLKNLRVIARLHDETLHLVVGSKSRIKMFADLAGKRVGIDSSKAATNYTVRSVLAAANMPTRRLRLSYQTAEQAARDLRDGKIDAFFVIGVAPINLVDGLVRRGQAKVIGLEPSTISALAKKQPMLSRGELPDDTYRTSRRVVTLNVASLWLVNKSMPRDVVQGILRSLWNPANRPELERLGAWSRTIKVAKAAENLPLPLHDGAQRFYAEAGR
ncbi:MAG: TAXI family TRAP transporter solute-binding subunit [Alphaproteobacteria bacterium]|mgnify:CR=1 FL=1|nr:TAXI family TRAP transporter solute-binding subunit [Alphaproteobacteria bacterium]